MISCIVRTPKEDKLFPSHIVVTVKVTPYSLEAKAFDEKEIPVYGGTATVLNKEIKLEDNICPSGDVQKIDVSKAITEAVAELIKICPHLKRADALAMVLEQGHEEVHKIQNEAIGQNH